MLQLLYLYIHIYIYTCLFRESSPIFMTKFLNKSYKFEIFSRAPRSSLNLTLITTWCSSFSHDIILLSKTTKVIYLISLSWYKLFGLFHFIIWPTTYLYIYTNWCWKRLDCSMNPHDPCHMVVYFGSFIWKYIEWNPWVYTFINCNTYHGYFEINNFVRICL